MWRKVLARAKTKTATSVAEIAGFSAMVTCNANYEQLNKLKIENLNEKPDTTLSNIWCKESKQKIKKIIHASEDQTFFEGKILFLYFLKLGFSSVIGFSFHNDMIILVMHKSALAR